MFRGKKEGTEPHWGELTAGMPPARSRFKDLLRRLQEAPNFLSLLLKQVRICLKTRETPGQFQNLLGQESARWD